MNKLVELVAVDRDVDSAREKLPNKQETAASDTTNWYVYVIEYVNYK